MAMLMLYYVYIYIYIYIFWLVAYIYIYIYISADPSPFSRGRRKEWRKTTCRFAGGCVAFSVHVLGPVSSPLGVSDLSLRHPAGEGFLLGLRPDLGGVWLF